MEMRKMKKEEEDAEQQKMGSGESKKYAVCDELIWLWSARAASGLKESEERKKMENKFVEQKKKKERRKKTK